MTVLIQQFPCTFITPAAEPIQGFVSFGWHSDIPALVRMDLQHPVWGIVPWYISRDLLVDCLVGDKDRPYGEGDYTVERGEVSGVITLAPPNQSPAQVSFFIEPLLTFVRDTLTHVPRGKAEDEPMQKLLDGWLEEMGC